MQQEPPSRKMLPLLFLVGLLEYVLIIWITDSVVAARRVAASFATFLYILVWYGVGRAVILGSPEYAVAYAAGCAVGTYITCPAKPRQ